MSNGFHAKFLQVVIKLLFRHRTSNRSKLPCPLAQDWMKFSLAYDF
jgi:hypothetical protein